MFAPFLAELVIFSTDFNETCHLKFHENPTCEPGCSYGRLDRWKLRSLLSLLAQNCVYNGGYLLQHTICADFHVRGVRFMWQPLATLLQFLSTLGLAYAFAARHRKHGNAANRVAELFSVVRNPWQVVHSGLHRSKLKPVFGIVV